MTTVNDLSTKGFGSAEVCVYNRVSTKEQADTEALNRMNYMCDSVLHGLGLDPSTVDHYQDVESGSNDDRPDFEKFRAYLQLGRYRLLICYRIDRLTRRLVTNAQLWELLEAHKMLICAANSDRVFDTNSRQDWHEFVTLGVRAQDEIKELRERVRKGLDYSAKLGKHIGAVPFGYKRVNGVLLFNDDPLPNSLMGLSYYQGALLAIELMCSGTGSTFSVINRINEALGTNRTYVTWRRWLETVTLRGHTIYNGDIRLSSHEAILTDEQYEYAVNNLVAQRYHRSVNDRNDNERVSSLFSGLVRCYHCERNMNFVKFHRKKSGEIYRYYCQTAKPKQPFDCPSRSINDNSWGHRGIDEDTIVEIVNVGLALHAEAIADIASQNPSADSVEISRLESQIGSLKSHLDKFGKSELISLQLTQLDAELNRLRVIPQMDSHLRSELIQLLMDGYLALANRSDLAAVYRRFIKTIVVDINKVVDVRFRI